MLIYVLIISVALLYYLLCKPLKYWENRNVPHIKPRPLVGNFGPLIAGQCSFTEMTQRIYNSHPNHRYFGFYQFLLPTLIARDPELIRKICVKGHDVFPQRRSVLLEKVDPLLARSLAFMKGGEKWNTLRTTLSPTFTGNKMRIIFDLIQDCADQFVEHFRNKGELVELEMKDHFTRYAHDVIASTTFGVVSNSLRDRDNEFYTMGLRASALSPFRGLKLFIQSFSPMMSQILSLSVVPKVVEDYFVSFLRRIMAERKDGGKFRLDMLHLLMEAKSGILKDDANDADTGFLAVQKFALPKIQTTNKPRITDEDIASQAFIFFMAGYDTTSTVMSFATYELAVNVHIQQKLQREIDATLESCNGKLTYEALMEMAYLEQIVCETLRKWPPVPLTDRCAEKPFTIEAQLDQEETVHFEKGTICWIPIFPIHRDPKYYPNPEVFDPERFHKDNLKNITPNTFLPFGVGVRNCIGFRFALLEIKLILFKILSSFDVVVTDKTQIPLVMSKMRVFLAGQNGVWLGLKPRNNGDL
ncbi:cytochrome P450 9e2-like [Photinus pyralis]|uniref:cytochrome P450 9e2-like n=1 Tax=Photinus pyralis TaxID=7054 RepID=UPI0012674239|nr:cytochrome P450 9e2-like [Photinus pyralis]